jgi:hypothetical protein
VTNAIANDATPTSTARRRAAAGRVVNSRLSDELVRFFFIPIYPNYSVPTGMDESAQLPIAKLVFKKTGEKVMKKA